MATTPPQKKRKAEKQVSAADTVDSRRRDTCNLLQVGLTAMYDYINAAEDADGRWDRLLELHRNNVPGLSAFKGKRSK